MTMQNAPHPDDERLAAYAGGDRDALGDRELVEHLAACDRCRPMVNDLSALHSALAALPDLVPSRPLRLIPPAPAPVAPRVGPLEWLRRLAAPAMAAGAGLVLIGAVGASGIAGQLSKDLRGMGASLESHATDTAASAAPAPGAGASPVLGPVTETGGSTFGSRSNPPGSRGPGDVASQAPASSQRENAFEPTSKSTDEQPWLTLVVAGVALFATSAALRFSLSPRAG